MKYQGRNIRVVTAEIQRDDRYLILKRPEDRLLPGYWEFPGGRVRNGAADEAALQRKLKQLLDVQAVVRECLRKVDHPYEHYTVYLQLYRVDIGAQPLRPKGGREYAWVAPEAFGDYKFPPADERTVSLLMTDLEEE